MNNNANAYWNDDECLMNPGNNNLFPLSYILLLLLYNIIIIILVYLRIYFPKPSEESSIIIIFVKSRVVFFTFLHKGGNKKNEMIIRLLLGLGSFLDGGGCWLPLFWWTDTRVSSSQSAFQMEISWIGKKNKRCEDIAHGSNEISKEITRTRKRKKRLFFFFFFFFCWVDDIFPNVDTKSQSSTLQRPPSFLVRLRTKSKYIPPIYWNILDS